ncbi:MFS transporter [Cryobacterium zhongshanensis]|uniref:MFS transporter n=1 Tax=Cryobacterium zhongshanensis TaxID=2928153 RepID=A0AA41QS11_9MICO|nr:MFS transporter [Cryobacterium zhongshanensis]MCI4656597.1 MFS transporter [Cryobacterium zhongshanensis]
MSLTSPIELPRFDPANGATAHSDRPRTGSVASTPPARFPWIGLLALSGAVFLSVTSEMLPTGLLPEMSADLGVPQSQTGLLVSWFAFTVVLTSTPLALLTKRLPRHGLIVFVLLVFALSNVLTALAPSYELVVATRVLGGLAHGLFWGVVGAYSAHLVPKEQIGRAISITISGGTLAFVFGVPLGTAAGHALGWRLSFVLLAVLMLIGAALVWRFLPKVEHYVAPPRSDRGAPAQATDAAASALDASNASAASVQPASASGSDPASVTAPASVPDPASAPLTVPAQAAAPRPQAPARRDPTIAPVALICVIAALIMIGHYSFYTYIAPFLIDGLGVDPSAIAPFLFAYGIAGAVGLLLSGTVFSARPQLGIVLGLVVSAVSVSALSIWSGMLPVAIVAFLLWGIAFGALPALLQTRLMHTASRRIRDTASAFYTTAFNTGIGGGALLGGILLERSGITSVPFVYVGILVAALVLVLVSQLVIRRRSAA